MLSASAPRAAPAPARTMQRSLSESGAKGKKKKKKQNQSTTKIVFVRGQFVDPSTKRGAEAVAASRSGEDSATGIATTVVGGIVSSVRSGHAGVLTTAPSDDGKAPMMKRGSSFGSLSRSVMRRKNSDASTNLLDSGMSK